MSKILIVEDEAHLAAGLQFNLESEGHSVEVAPTGEMALDSLLLDKNKFDAVVLDVMLPGTDGFAVARELRKAKNFVPILILTARGRPEDILKGFESGADDYLPKPFNLAILIARIDSLLRRRNWMKSAGAETAKSRTAVEETERSFQFGDKTIDFENLQLRVGKQVHQLTLMETDLLRYLTRNSGHPVSRRAILQDVWNLHEDTDTRAIDNFVVRLRRYIEKEPTKPRHLLTVRGLGYQFVPNPGK
jgi:DNA-binding response OmpR family regulator